MATPYISGVVALMLDADPTLSPDEIREILTSTATKMPGREEWEVGAGFVNAHAAVDKVFNRSKPYRNIQDAMYNAVFDGTSARAELPHRFQSRGLGTGICERENVPSNLTSTSLTSLRRLTRLPKKEPETSSGCASPARAE